MNRLALIAAVPVAILLTYGAKYWRQTSQLELDNFTAEEFGFWWPLMSPKLLKNLDRARHITRSRIKVSPVDGAIGRFLGQGNESQHNVDAFGEVRAVDIMPVDMHYLEFYEKVKQAELFSGIGVYPDWRPQPGLHVDVREDRTPGHPALWSAFKNAQTGEQEYFAIERALV